MADATLTKLLQLASEAGSGSLRHAALKVLGSVGTKDAKLVKMLIGALADTEQDVRISAIEALGQLQVEEALPHLDAFVKHGGPELEAAVHTACQLGSRGSKRIGKVMQEVSPSIKARIAAVLVKSNTGNALVVTAQGLLDVDPKVVDSTARSLAMEVPGYTSPQRHLLAKFLIDSLGEKNLAPKSEASLLRVLSALHEAKAEELFWARIIPPFPHDVRVAALQALNDVVPTTEKRLQALLTCAAEKDFQIVAASLMILKKVPVNAKNSKHWIKLLEAPDVATRRFAVEKLQGIENAEVARAMLVQLRHPDRVLREDTLKALRSYGAGRAALVDEMIECDGVEPTWFLARALAESRKEITAAQRAKIFEQATNYHDADDRRAAPLLFLLREIDHAWLRDQLEAKALERRKKKKYGEAIGYYKVLAQDPACSEESRFELAATGLKESARDLSPENRAADPSLHQFARLLQNPSFDLIDHITKAKWLGEEELFYVGFHFAEQTHRAKDFGKHVLELVVQRFPKSEVGKQAKRKLKSVSV